MGDEALPRELPALVAALRARHPCPHHLSLRLAADYAARIESNDPALIEQLAAYFCEFLGAPPAGVRPTVITAIQAAPPAIERSFDAAGFTTAAFKPGPRGPKEAYLDIPGGRLVRKLRTGMVFAFGGRDHAAIGDCLANDNQVHNFVCNRLIQRRLDDGCLLGHAASVSHEGGRTLVIAGFSGMGKSTLSLRAMDTPGSIFISNDRVMLEREGDAVIVHGVPKHPRINPGTILHNERLSWLLTPAERAEFAALEGDALWGLEHKYDGLIHRSFGTGKFRLRARLSALVLLNWRRDVGPAALREIDLNARRELLPAIMKDPGAFYLAAGAGSRATEDDYVAAFAGVPVFEFAGGVDFERAAAFCGELLQGSRG
ncbi:MAG: HprK-related kinase B [Myxococcales bacterium]|nr:HprK-related kinase B [Myxococcales bacterium]